MKRRGLNLSDANETLSLILVFGHLFMLGKNHQNGMLLDKKLVSLCGKLHMISRQFVGVFHGMSELCGFNPTSQLLHIRSVPPEKSRKRERETKFRRQLFLTISAYIRSPVTCITYTRPCFLLLILMIDGLVCINESAPVVDQVSC